MFSNAIRKGNIMAQADFTKEDKDFITNDPERQQFYKVMQ
jgi:hypothetical protein